MNHKISVVIPAYNAEKSISEAIQSILVQDYGAYEIIIVDDGSYDHTRDVISQISSSLIKYIYQPNGGPSKARNNGILHSSGDYIAFMDADDVWYPCHLRNAVNFFVKYPNTYWFSSAFNIELINHKIIYRGINTKDCNIDFFSHSLHRSFLGTPSVVINRLVFEDVGVFNESWKFGEDLNLWVRIALKFPNIGYNATPGAIFRQTQGSLTFDKNNYNLKNTLKVIYFTNKAVELSNNVGAHKLINQWIEDAIYSAALNDNSFIINYIRNRWKRRIGLISKIIVLCYNFLPLLVIKVLNYLIKAKRRLITNSCY